MSIENHSSYTYLHTKNPYVSSLIWSIKARHSITRLASTTEQSLFTPGFEPAPPRVPKIRGQYVTLTANTGAVSYNHQRIIEAYFRTSTLFFFFKTTQFPIYFVDDYRIESPDYSLFLHILWQWRDYYCEITTP